MFAYDEIIQITRSGDFRRQVPGQHQDRDQNGSANQGQTQQVFPAAAPEHEDGDRHHGEHGGDRPLGQKPDGEAQEKQPAPTALALQASIKAGHAGGHAKGQCHVGLNETHGNEKQAGAGGQQHCDAGGHPVGQCAGPKPQDQERGKGRQQYPEPRGKRVYPQAGNAQRG